MKDDRKSDQAQARGHSANQGPTEQASSRANPDRGEQHQRTKDHAPTDMTNREERIRQRAHEIWEAEGRPEGQADRHWSRAAEDLDREDTAIQREGIAGEKPGVRPQGDADFVRDKS
jgi:Protein of unknown function (DUF2934)